jgi:uncharacterized protein YaaR (DUF327 family)
MANIVFPDGSSPLFNPAAYGEVSAEARKTKVPAGRPGKAEKVKRRPFSSLFEAARDTAAPEKLPVSEESLHQLLDDVHSAGDALSRRPFPEEIKAYKQAVRNFVNYVVENGYTMEHENGIPKYSRPGIKEHRRYTKIQVIDKKLEGLAAAIMRGQANQFSILAKTDEIRGLLIDLME